MRPGIQGRSRAMQDKGSATLALAAGSVVAALVSLALPYPLTALLIAGAVGYLLAYLIHGSGFRWGREDVPDYARTRDDDRRR
jgi:hypothetical protein